MVFLFEEYSHVHAVELQIGAGATDATSRTRCVDGDGNAVDTRAANGEDTSVRAVDIVPINEDVFVDDDLCSAKGAVAAHVFVIIEADREDTAAGCGCREIGTITVIKSGSFFVLLKYFDDVCHPVCVA